MEVGWGLPDFFPVGVASDDSVYDGRFSSFGVSESWTEGIDFDIFRYVHSAELASDHNTFHREKDVPLSTSTNFS